MNIYYDTEFLKESLPLFNPIYNWKMGTYGSDSILETLVYGILLGVFGTPVIWVTFPILFLLPFKIKKNGEQQ